MMVNNLLHKNAFRYQEWLLNKSQRKMFLMKNKKGHAPVPVTQIP